MSLKKILACIILIIFELITFGLEVIDIAYCYKHNYRPKASRATFSQVEESSQPL
jgi:hypothetical protein